MSDLYVSSRYYNQSVDFIQLEDGGDITPVVFYQFDNISGQNYYLYTYKKGDKLYQLSYKFFGRPDMWWAIAEYNPQIQNIMNINPGTVIRIPNV